MIESNLKYLNLSNQINATQDELDIQATNIINDQSLTDAYKWYTGLSVCYVAVQHNIKSEVLTDLFVALNNDSNRELSAFYLSDEDYAKWFDDVVFVLKGFAENGINIGYVYLHQLYLNGRFGHKDEKLAIAYLQEGYAKGDKTAQSYVGYSMYYGNLGFEQDKEEGLRLVYDSFAEENKLGELFALNIEFGQCESGEEAEAVLEKYHELIHVKKRGLYVLADYYLREEKDEEALETLKDGIENNSGYCSYLLGLMIVNQRFANFGFTTEQGRAYLETGFSHEIPYAGFIKGYTYLYPNDGSEVDFEKAMNELDHASKYNSQEAQLELGMLYLYHNDYRDVAKGMELLERAIDAGFVKAMTEKAYVLLDTGIVERDVESAKQLLDVAFEAGNDYAAYRLGLGYQDADWEAEPNIEKALELFEIAAERGNAIGTEYVAKYNRFGYGCEVNYDKARAFYQQAIELSNSAYSKVELGMMFELGEGGGIDQQAAKELYESALEDEYFYAAARLAFMYEEGIEGEPDLEAARSYFQIAAEGNIASGVYHLARFYRYGLGGEVDEEKAFDLFEQALELDFVDANVDIALAYEEQTCGKSYDPEKAYQYMLIAAEAGFTYAMYKVGVYHMYNTVEGASKEQALHWLNQAAEGGSPVAMLTLGDFYLYGYSEDDDYFKAFEYYQKAEEEGYISEGIGVCYQYELGVEKDNQKAFNYYKIAAEKQYVSAIFRLGVCYYYGVGTEQDRVEAFHYLKMVADQGNKDACGYIGQMYASGDGVEKDAVEGVNYLLEAAEAGFAEAQYHLANCYLKGEGTPQSDELAMQWYQQAAENGQEDAQKIIGGPRKRRS